MSTGDEEETLDRDDEEVAGTYGRDPETLLSILPQFFRGEVNQMTNGLNRLDQTTNWAITLIAALVTIVFSTPDISPHVLLIGLVVLCIFLTFDVRRYRFYDMHRARVRFLKENVFANALDPRGVEHPRWREELSQDLRKPTYKVTLWEATARRLRRIYGLLFMVVGLAWGAKVTLLTPEFWTDKASLGPIPGLVVALLLAGFLLAVTVVSVRPGDREAKGEIHGEAPGRWK